MGKMDRTTRSYSLVLSGAIRRKVPQWLLTFFFWKLFNARLPLGCPSFYYVDDTRQAKDRNKTYENIRTHNKYRTLSLPFTHSCFPALHQCM